MKIFGITKNGGSYVRIDFDRKYYEGETVEFSFGIHQHHLYQTIDGMRVYRFTPGWFDEIVVDELNIYWKSDNIKYVLNGYWGNGWLLSVSHVFGGGGEIHCKNRI